MAKAKLIVDTQLCKGCGLCITVCPKKLLELNRECTNNKGYNVMRITDEGACSLCASCAITCPDTAITLERIEE